MMLSMFVNDLIDIVYVHRWPVWDMTVDKQDQQISMDNLAAAATRVVQSGNSVRQVKW